MIPDLLQMITGVDLVAATVDAAMGKNNIDLSYVEQESHYATRTTYGQRRYFRRHLVSWRN